LLSGEQKLDGFTKDSKYPEFVSPKYDGQCISNLPDTFCKLLHVKNEHSLSSPSLYDYANQSNIENLVFLLLDGFGYNSIQYALEKFGLPSFEKVQQRSFILPLTSVFPSTTSTATTCLHTGLTPQEHGIVGYTMYMSEIGAIAQMLDMGPVFGRRSLFEIGFDPAKFIGKMTLHEKLAASGIPSNLYINKYIVGSGLSQITNRGANIVPILTSPDLFVSLRKNLESRESGGANFHFAYYATPDTIAHARGPFTATYASEVEAIFHTIQRELYEKLDNDIAKRTLLLISADHGLAQIKQENIIDIALHPDLLRMLKVPPTGDSRCLVLHSRSKEEIQKIEDYFRHRFSDQFLVMESIDALKKGLFGFGEVKESLRDRIGDLIAIPKGNAAVDNSNVQPRTEYVPGRHGGLSKDEMIVPLIASKLA
jgi:hypothetical protein